MPYLNVVMPFKFKVYSCHIGTKVMGIGNDYIAIVMVMVMITFQKMCNLNGNSN